MIIEKGMKCIAYAGIFAGSNQCLCCSNMSYFDGLNVRCTHMEKIKGEEADNGK